jgi:hypothetical protein
MQGDPPPLEDFCFYRQQQPGERPPVEAGAAMLELIDQGLFPPFALAFYEPLNIAGQNQPPPPRLALVAGDAILLAPVATTGGWRGFLIAEDTAAGQQREFQAPDLPEPVRLIVPLPADGSAAAVWAAAAAFLPTPPSPDTPD